MTSASLKLGFIGLGIMGAPMALHLANAGHQLFVNTVGELPASIASSSAQACASAEEVTRNADIGVREDLAADLLDEMEQVLQERRMGDCVRLEIAAAASEGWKL